MSTSPPIVPALSQGGTIAGNLVVTGTIASQSSSFPAISALTGGMKCSTFQGTGGNAFDALNTGGYRASESANGKQGTATLTAGTVTVANTNVTANSRIFLTANTPGGTPGWLQISARTAGTSFTILSSSSLDTSVVAYEIFEPG